MKNEIDNLVIQFKNIKNLGFIQSINNYTNGGGLTLEYLLGIKANNKCLPDLNGIELKTINQYWEKNINLFSYTPKSNYKYTTKWITENFGYINRKQQKNFNGKVCATKLSKIGIKYFFKLEINEIQKKIYMEIYDSKKNLIKKDIYWDYKVLKKKLERKLTILALIYLEKKYIKKKQYCKYNSIKIYKLKNFETFITLLKKGIIKINFSTSYMNYREKKVIFRDHGTKFFINERHIHMLFNEIKKD